MTVLHTNTIRLTLNQAVPAWICWLLALASCQALSQEAIRDAGVEAVPSGSNTAQIERIMAGVNSSAASNLAPMARDSGVISPEEQGRILLQMARDLVSRKEYERAFKTYKAVLTFSIADTNRQMVLLEMAILAQQEKQLTIAQQYLAEYARRYPSDLNIPEVYLRQGLVYREMGATTLALSKFYTVMTSALSIKHGHLETYQRLVAQAQSEIAETYYQQGNFEQGAQFFSRLLKLEARDLNKRVVHYKLVRCLAEMKERTDQTTVQAEEFLRVYPRAPEVPEVRFLLLTALKQQGQKEAALQQVYALLQTPERRDDQDPERQRYWQQRAGNEIGNLFYLENDYVNALAVYSALAELDSSPAWQIPAWYQMGLIYERLEQPQRAIDIYKRIAKLEKELASSGGLGVKTVIDMAVWRKNFVQWQNQAGRLSKNTLDPVSHGPSSTVQ